MSVPMVYSKKVVLEQHFRIHQPVHRQVVTELQKIVLDKLLSPELLLPFLKIPRKQMYQVLILVLMILRLLLLLILSSRLLLELLQLLVSLRYFKESRNMITTYKVMQSSKKDGNVQEFILNLFDIVIYCGPI